METAVTIKGQVVIPAKIRTSFGNQKGHQVLCRRAKGRNYSSPAEQGVLPGDEWYS